MLAQLTPSVEMTGGPWYTDNELDTEFIKLLSESCAHYIREQVLPSLPPPCASADHVNPDIPKRDKTL
jgi:DNA-directed RNA polymerase III subunit RPC6